MEKYVKDNNGHASSPINGLNLLGFILNSSVFRRNPGTLLSGQLFNGRFSAQVSVWR